MFDDVISGSGGVEEEREGEGRFVKVLELCQRGANIKTAKIESAETLIIP